MPLAALRPELLPDEPLPDTLSRLARSFKVSTLVILRRLLDVNWLTRERFDNAWVREIERLTAIVQGGSGGGDFYRTTLARVSHRFARALVVEHARRSDALSGRLLDARRHQDRDLPTISGAKPG